MSVNTGDLITVTYEDREFQAIVIDPDGLGPGESSVGFGFRMASQHIGIPQQTLTYRVTQTGGVEGPTASGTETAIQSGRRRSPRRPGKDKENGIIQNKARSRLLNTVGSSPSRFSAIFP